MKRTPRSFSHPRRERGAVLFVALVFLVLIALLGLTAASTSVLEERMIGGMRNNQLGVMGAETAARGAETYLWTLANTSAKFYCGYNGSGGCFSTQSTAAPSGTGSVFLENPKVRAFRTVPTWLPVSTSGGTAYSGGTMTGMTGSVQSASLAQQPQYMIEYMGLQAPPGSSGGDPCMEKGSENRYRCGTSGGGTSLFNYRIIGRSTGGNNSTVRVIETYFGTGIPSL
jgi:type IV pilus assembly protein PilX